MFIYVKIEVFRLIEPIKAIPVNLQNYGHYKISYWGGKVINTKTKNILNYWKNEHGYRRVRLTNGKLKTFMYVHRLVGLSWITNPENKEEINHKNKIRINCDVPNLEWMTRQENMAHQFYSEPTEIIEETIEIEDFPVLIDNNETTPF